MTYDATNIAWINEKLAICFCQSGDQAHARKDIKHTGFYKKGQHPFRFCPLVYDALEIRYNPPSIPPMAPIRGSVMLYLVRNPKSTMLSTILFLYPKY